MLICLSSEARLRYREDVLRAITLPRGARLLLRYRFDLVPEGLRKELEEGALNGHAVCVVHLDTQAKPNPKGVPCRDGVVIQSYLSGNAIFVEAELGDFWVASDSTAFTQELAATTGGFPAWSGPKLVGKFVHKIGTMPGSARKSDRLEDWATIVSSLRTCTAFSKHPFFYFVRGVFPLSASRFWRSKKAFAMQDPVKASNGRFKLKPNVTYVIVIRSEAFTDAGDEIPFWLILNSEEELLSFSTAKHLSIDSPYDEKQIHFRSASVPFDVDSAITFFSQRTQLQYPDVERSTLDFDLYITTKSDWPLLSLKALILGAALSGQGIFMLWKTAGTLESNVGSALILLGIGIVAGFVASFGLKKL
jgi:hypothetical protein